MVTSKSQFKSSRPAMSCFLARQGLFALSLLTSVGVASAVQAQETPKADADSAPQAKLPYDVDDVFTVFSGRSKMLYEGESTRKRFVMSINTEGFNRPKAPVKIRAYLSDPSEAGLNYGEHSQADSVELNFKKWGKAAEFSVEGLDDKVADGNKAFELRFAPTQSEDPRFHGVQLPAIPLISVDNEKSARYYDDPYLEVITDRRGLSEGDKRRINVTMRLKQCPSWFGAWILPLIDDPSEARIVGGTRFEHISAFDWRREINLQIEMVNDQEADGDQQVKLLLPGMISTWSGMSFGCGFGTRVDWHIPQPLSFTVHDNEKPGEPAPRATILKHGWDHPPIPNVVRGIEDIAAAPFDGIMISGGDSTRVFSDKRLSQQVMQEALKPLTKLDFGTTQQNYLKVGIAKVEGGFNGDGFKNLIENFRDLGRAVAELGLDGMPLEGIAFDSEVYGRGNPWDWPEACPGLEQEACAQAAFEAGEDMMEALIEGWPTVRFMPFFGFWLHDPATWKQLSKYSPHPNAVQKEDMFGYFAAGIFAATVGTDAKYIDGGELYYLRTARQYLRTRKWLRGAMVDGSPYLPEAYKEPYKKLAKTGFGLYDDRTRHWGRSPEAVPVVWESIIDSAKREADVIWLYTERHDWWPNDGYNWPTHEGAEGGIRGTRGYVDDEWYQATLRAILAR